ncbi:hypothetical protein AB0D57_05710 [Streptomyces sp. NPDC048275]|uniref:hypothetical protein n=1 Tax=Streptomyces sp. NPDC048275 TaxID=3155629 RepID=UPI0033FD4B8B
MAECTVGFLELLLLALVRALLPARGRHRAAPVQPPGQESPLTLASPSPSGHPLDVWPFEPDTHLVRPYLLTPQERHERRLRRQRRRALWLAVHGIDVGPRHIHGVEVAA